MTRRGVISVLLSAFVLLVVSAPAAPTTGSWTPTGSMAIARSQSFTLTRLPSGQVLVAGGLVGMSSSAATAQAELWDPATGIWTPTGAMSTPRSRHIAVLLGSGRVLVAGGQLPNGFSSASAEIYDAASGTWAATGSMAVPRANFDAAVLADGRVLVTGGVSYTGRPGAGNAVTKSAEIYDPGTGTWSEAAPMAAQRYVHKSSLLPDGRVLVTGGSGVTSHCIMRDTAEVYDPAADRWTNVASMSVARSTHLAEVLPSGAVLVAGGWSLPVKNCGNDGILETATDSAELFDSGSGGWSATGSLNDRRGAISAAQLTDGRVLVAGGRIERPGIGTARTAKAEIYDLASGTWQPAGSMAAARSGNVLVDLADGRALVAGGGGSTGPLATAEVYTP